jgi:carbamoyl-phosphate synthase small subunit
LVLEDGTVFQGFSIGADKSAVGEVVFNTSMTGYQEILTDPSYQNQIVTLTYPHVGSVGCNEEDMESLCARSAGLIIRDLPLRASNFRSNSSLSEWMKTQDSPRDRRH